MSQVCVSFSSCSASNQDFRKTIVTKDADKVDVEVKCSFISVFRIDIINHEFQAEIEVVAKWREPKLKNNTPAMEAILSDNNFDQTNIWDPKLLIRNCVGDPLNESIVYKLLIDNDDVIIQKSWHFKGTFKEKMELQKFPIDMQDLNIVVSASRPSSEVQLLSDNNHEVSTDTQSTISQEWNLSHFVDGEQGEVTVNGLTYPVLKVRCTATRRIGFYFWNVFVVVFLLTVLGFTAHTVDKSSEDRLMISMTLILTMVAFKLSLQNITPPVNYLTILDICVLSGFIFLTLETAQSAVSHLLYRSTPAAADQYGNITILGFSGRLSPEFVGVVDKRSLEAVAIIFGVLNAAFIVYCIVTFIQRRRTIKLRERNKTNNTVVGLTKQVRKPFSLKGISFKNRILDTDSEAKSTEDDSLGNTQEKVPKRRKKRKKIEREDGYTSTNFTNS